MRILVVEDEQRIVSYLSCNLEAEGFTVDTALDGNTALEKILSQHYDVITLDIMLPGMNGYAVCKELRMAGVTTPVLMLTAKDGEFDEADALDIGADDFLRKPFSMVVLVARLRALLRRGEIVCGETLQAADLTLNPAKKTVKRDGEEIILTPREFGLLEYLMYNKGFAVSKRSLLEHVWGLDFAPDENVVEVYIRYLRKKIDEPFSTALIKTVRNVGYKIDEA